VLRCRCSETVSGRCRYRCRCRCHNRLSRMLDNDYDYDNDNDNDNDNEPPRDFCTAPLDRWSGRSGAFPGGLSMGDADRPPVRDLLSALRHRDENHFLHHRKPDTPISIPIPTAIPIAIPMNACIISERGSWKAPEIGQDGPDYAAASFAGSSASPCSAPIAPKSSKIA
jgi:hypothetical protein